MLEQLIVCFNYDGLLDSDIEEVIKKTRKYFVEKGFTLNRGIHKNVNVQLQDPGKVVEPLASTVREIEKYVFEKGNIIINITKNSLDLSVSAGLGYDGFDIYKQYIMHIYNDIISLFSDIVSIQRIGVRKINSLFIRDINTVNNYFVSNLINCNLTKGVVSGEYNQIAIAKNHLTLFSDCNKVNIVTEVQTGEAQEIKEASIKTFNVSRIILDIDAYWDNELNNIKCKEITVDYLNKIVTETYYNSLNQDFRDKLKNNNIADDNNIFGGVK